MKCFVTGATGFIGANLVHELVARGHTVRALLRPGADLRGLAGVSFEPVHGDVLDKSDALADAMRGCDWCFHTAAVHALWLREYRPMFQTNVLGTQKVIRAAGKAGCQRIVYTSAAACLGHARRGSDGRWVPADETTPASEAQMNTAYRRSKWQAEAAARELIREGAPVVIVNPTNAIGARDVKPSPTGQMIADFLRRRLLAPPDAGQNFVPVRDVAAGHVLAAERGRVGERYILGSAAGNWTLRHAVEVLVELTGLPAPAGPRPLWFGVTAAQAGELRARLTRRPPRMPLAALQQAEHQLWFNPAKAVAELGLPQSSLPAAFEEAVAWFRQNGHVPGDMK